MLAGKLISSSQHRLTQGCRNTGRGIAILKLNDDAPLFAISQRSSQKLLRIGDRCLKQRCFHLLLFGRKRWGFLPVASGERQSDTTKDQEKMFPHSLQGPVPSTPERAGRPPYCNRCRREAWLSVPGRTGRWRRDDCPRLRRAVAGAVVQHSVTKIRYSTTIK